MAKKSVTTKAVDPSDPAFRSWFGRSVTHESGVPHRYYTGTSKDVDFPDFKVARHGTWFTRDPEEASGYAEQNDSQNYKFEGGKYKKTNTASRVIPAYVKAENPYTGDRPEHMRYASNYKKAQSDWFDTLRAQGHDSWIPASAGGNLAVVLGHPGQIKSAVSNTGDFDPNQQRIDREHGGFVDAALNATRRHRADGGADVAPQRELSPLGFYSHGAEMAAALPQAKGTPDQMIASLRRAAVKPDELFHSGIADETATMAKRAMIESQYAPQTAQAEKALKALRPEYTNVKQILNDPAFKEAAKNKQTPEGQAKLFYDKTMNPIRSEIDSTMVLNKDLASRPSVTRDELAQHFKQAMPKVEERYIKGDDPASALSRYGRGTKLVLPGGENHREVLLKLPVEAQKEYQDLAAEAALYGKRLLGEQLPTGETVQQKLDNIYAKQEELKQNSFSSSHWQDDPNVLAHLRLSDRTGPNGEKILHVEEIQSDWGQEGRKHGWKASPEERALHHAARAQIDAGNEDLKAIGERLVAEAGLPDRANHMMSIRNLPHDARHQAMEEYESRVHKVLQHPEYREALDRQTALLDKLRPSLIKDEGDIVHGPFVTSTPGWTDLALKRVLKEAADGGYHKVIWTPGAEQAKRYSLSNQIDELAHWREGDQIGLSASGPNGTVFDQKMVSPEELPALVGQDLSKKILNGEGSARSISGFPEEAGVNFISGDGLSVGGEGMKSYYDQMVPKRLQELIKKHDKNAKVGMTDIMLPPVSGKGHNNLPIQALGFDMTPQMVKSIQRGQALFKDGGLVDAALNIARQHKVT